jgi:hypothetical protein
LTSLRKNKKILSHNCSIPVFAKDVDYFVCIFCFVIGSIRVFLFVKKYLSYMLIFLPSVFSVFFSAFLFYIYRNHLIPFAKTCCSTRPWTTSLMIASLSPSWKLCAWPLSKCRYESFSSPPPPLCFRFSCFLLFIFVFFCSFHFSVILYDRFLSLSWKLCTCRNADLFHCYHFPLFSLLLPFLLFLLFFSRLSSTRPETISSSFLPLLHKSLKITK